MIGASRSVERYEVLGELATGGMATVYFGRQRGAHGFSRAVAIKSMHPQLAKDPNFRAMFIDEANLTARIRHPNVVPTLDVVSAETKLLIVMEYVEGVSLSVLLHAAKQRGLKLPVAVVSAIVQDVLHGLHAAHELTDETGAPLGVIHRDISPQNVLVGVDGVARVVDFGVAKATGRSYQTQTGEIRGKVGYMAPEQMFGEQLDRRVDLYATGVVLWEALAGERLFNAPTDAALVLLVTQGNISPPSLTRGERLPDGLDRLIERSLSYAPGGRPSTAMEMQGALAALAPAAARSEVGQLVRQLVPEEIAKRVELNRGSSPTMPTARLEPEARAVLEVLTRATMSRDVTFPTAPSKRRLPYAVAGLALLTTAAFGVTYALMRPKVEPVGKALVASASPPPVTPPEPPLPPPASAAPPPAAEIPTASSPKRPAPTTKRTAKPAPSSSSVTPAPVVHSDPCKVPYTTDAEGHRHYKEECLK